MSITRLRHAIAVLPLLAAGACIPLPIAHHAQVTPFVEGTLRYADGTPAAHVPVATTGDWKDRTCAAKGAHSVTDASGRFRIEAARERRRVFWLTMMENLGMTGYSLCAGGTASPGSTGVAGDSTSIGRTSVRGRIGGDSIACIAWRSPARAELTCHNWANPKLVEGGEWAEAGVAGYYRLLFTDASYASRAWVQWIVPTSGAGTGARITVRAQVELPTGPAVDAYGATLGGLPGHARVRVRSIKPTKWGNERWLEFELGAPGEVPALQEN